jgi:hypothetical protein
MHADEAIDYSRSFYGPFGRIYFMDHGMWKIVASVEWMIAKPEHHRRVFQEAVWVGRIVPA